MALNKYSLKIKILSELQTQGFNMSGGFAWAQKFAEAVANAVVDEITQNAIVTGADSNGDSHNLPIL